MTDRSDKPHRFSGDSMEMVYVGLYTDGAWRRVLTSYAFSTFLLGRADDRGVPTYRHRTTRKDAQS